MNAAMRILTWLIALALVALPVVAVVNGWIGADRWPLTRLRVQGELTRVDPAQLQATVLPYAKRGFFAVRLEDAKRAVEQLPWVERAWHYLDRFPEQGILVVVDAPTPELVDQASSALVTALKSDRQHFRVRGWVGEFPCTVAGAGDDPAAAYDDGPHGNLSSRSGGARLFQRDIHVACPGHVFVRFLSLAGS